MVWDPPLVAQLCCSSHRCLISHRPHYIAEDTSVHPGDRCLTTLRHLGSRASRDTGPRCSWDLAYVAPSLLVVNDTRELSFSGSYLECLCTSSGGSSPLILESLTTPSGVTTIIIHKLPLSLHLFLPYAISISSYIIVFFFFLFDFSILLLSIICFNFAALHHHHHIIMFSLCPLEVNLHTYLTTWLSSCPVRIFFGFLTIIVNLKNHKQNGTLN